MRRQRESGFAIRHALGVDAAPLRAGNAERFEQLLLGEIECALSGLFGDQGREDIGIAAVVVELAARRVRHRLVKDEGGTVRTLVHPDDGLVRRLRLSFHSIPEVMSRRVWTVIAFLFSSTF